MSYKIDLHTHSERSYDGMMKLEHYKKILDEGILDFVAITDHNEIDNALKIRELLGERIIVGEEIKTDKGDLIGLFLEEKISKGTPLLKAAEQIKEQNGLVYVPHPFDLMRSGLNLVEVSTILSLIDIFEVFNARYILPGGNKRAKEFARRNALPTAAGSDSHSFVEIGSTFTLIDKAPTRENLVEQLSNSGQVTKYVKPLYYLNPKKNRLIKLLKR